MRQFVKEVKDDKIEKVTEKLYNLRLMGWRDAVEKLLKLAIYDSDFCLTLRNQELNLNEEDFLCLRSQKILGSNILLLERRNLIDWKLSSEKLIPATDDSNFVCNDSIDDEYFGYEAMLDVFGIFHDFHV
ncbi:2604_t:CDS:2 [Gigaspora rosea]|nr:2604_t:CDS:2 [Gigaspora rosea]